MKSLVSTDWLAEHLHDPNIVIADVRWIHMNPSSAYQSYLAGHIPGAIYVDLDMDLANIGDYSKGRHPLPLPEQLAQRLANKGIGQGKRVIVTEEESFKVAARMWWLLRWIGVDDVAILDGGFYKWKSEGREVETEQKTQISVAPFEIHLRPNLMTSAEHIASRIADGQHVFDARMAERFRGEIEPLDKRAGHIHGAGNIPLSILVEGDPPRLKSIRSLGELFDTMGLEQQQPVTAYCGSGVTACQLLWAMDVAGYSDLTLYPGSWSEWIELHPEAGATLT